MGCERKLSMHLRAISCESECHASRDNLTWLGCFPLQSGWGSSKCLIQRIPVDNLKPNAHKFTQKSQVFGHCLQSGKMLLFLTGLRVQIAADVEGCGSPGGGPGEVGSIFLRVGFTLFLIHVATLELWLLTPSAALLTESIRSPAENECQSDCNHRNTHTAYVTKSDFAITHSWFLYY